MYIICVRLESTSSEIILLKSSYKVKFISQVIKVTSALWHVILPINNNPVMIQLSSLCFLFIQMYFFLSSYQGSRFLNIPVTCFDGVLPSSAETSSDGVGWCVLLSAVVSEAWHTCHFWQVIFVTPPAVSHTSSNPIRWCFRSRQRNSVKTCKWYVKNLLAR